MVTITGCEVVSHIFQDRWKNWKASSDACADEVRLQLESGLKTSDGLTENGWSFDIVEEKNRAVYVQGSKTVFALQYEDVKDGITVCVKDEFSGSARAGLQYGLMLALYQQYIGLHGVTLLCGHEIIILSAPSGTGKTTLAKLLETYCDAIVINGDFALLHPTEDGVIFEPTPFCGTSGRALNHRFQVSRVVFLSQAKENVWRMLDGREAMTRFMNNCFIPVWDSDMRKTVQDNILKCISTVKVNAYGFAPTREAAEYLLKKIEEDASIHSG